MTGKTAGETNKNNIKSVHITRDLFCDWQEGKLKGKEETDFLGHIGACTFCAEHFGTWMEEGLQELEMYLEPKQKKYLETEELLEREKTDQRSYLETEELLEQEKTDQRKYLETEELLEQEIYLKTERFPSAGLADRKTETFLAEPPKYLKEEILNRTRQMDVQAAVKLKETSRQMQLFMYSLKVGLAVVASIFLLSITADIQNVNLELPENQRMEQIQEKRREAKKQQDSKEQERSITDRLRKGSSWVTSILNDVSSGIFRVEIEDSENERNQEVTR